MKRMFVNGGLKNEKRKGHATGGRKKINCPIDGFKMEGIGVGR